MELPGNAAFKMVAFADFSIRVETLEREILALEAEKAALEESLSSGSLGVDELTAQSQRIAELIGLIDEKTMRWLLLSER